VTETFVRIAATILQALAIIVTAIFASRSLHAWRQQLIGKRKFEIAEEILVATYKMRGNLAHVRGPLAWGGEGKSRPRQEDAVDSAADRKDMYFVPLERMQKLNDDFAQISKARLLAQVHFGPDAGTPFDAIARVFHDVAVAAHMLINTADERRPDVGEDLVSGWEKTIWAISGGGDELATTISSAVSEIEMFCRPALAESGGWGWWCLGKRMGRD
jgi:hypothetical protein